MRGKVIYQPPSTEPDWSYYYNHAWHQLGRLNDRLKVLVIPQSLQMVFYLFFISHGSYPHQPVCFGEVSTVIKRNTILQYNRSTLVEWHVCTNSATYVLKPCSSLSGSMSPLCQTHYLGTISAWALSEIQRKNSHFQQHRNEVIYT